MNRSTMHAMLWQHATTQAQRLLAIGALLLLFAIGTIGLAALQHGGLAQDDPPIVHAAGLAVPQHGGLAEDPPPVIKGTAP